MTDADVRKRCEQVFRDATGHPSFLGRGGVDLRDVFAGMIRAAYADGQRDGMERAAKMYEDWIAGKWFDAMEFQDAIRQAAGEVGRGGRML